MMVVFDAAAVLAYLKDEPAAEEVSGLLRQGGALTALGIAEVLSNLVRVDSTADEAVLDVAELGLLHPILIDSYLAIHGSRLHASHYHRKKRAVSLADCIAAAAASQRAHQLVTSDCHLLDMCHEADIAYVAIPNSQGEVWKPEIKKG